MLLMAKQSISMGHLYHSYVSLPKGNPQRLPGGKSSNYIVDYPNGWLWIIKPDWTIYTTDDWSNDYYR